MLCESTTPVSGEKAGVSARWVSASATAARAWATRARAWLDCFGARAFADEFEAFGGLGGAGLGDFELSLGGSKSRSAITSFAAQILLADEVEPDTVALGFGAVQRGLGRGDFLRSRAGFEFGQCCFGAGQFGAAKIELLFLLSVVEPGDKLSDRDAFAFGNGRVGDPAGHLETELGVGDLDVAGEEGFVSTCLVVAQATAEEQQRRREGECHDGQLHGVVRKYCTFHNLCVRTE
jgi:hypothetical protein